MAVPALPNYPLDFLYSLLLLGMEPGCVHSAYENVIGVLSMPHRCKHSFESHHPAEHRRWLELFTSV